MRTQSRKGGLFNKRVHQQANSIVACLKRCFCRIVVCARCVPGSLGGYDARLSSVRYWSEAPVLGSAQTRTLHCVAAQLHQPKCLGQKRMTGSDNRTRETSESRVPAPVVDATRQPVDTQWIKLALRLANCPVQRVWHLDGHCYCCSSVQLEERRERLQCYGRTTSLKQTGGPRCEEDKRQLNTSVGEAEQPQQLQNLYSGRAAA